MSKRSVAVVRGEDRYSIVTKALQLIRDDVNPASIRGRRVLVKPNLVSSSIELAATHIDAVRAVVDFLQPFEPKRILVAEGSASDTWEAYERFGYRSLEKDYGNLELLDLNGDSYDTILLETLYGNGKEVRISHTAKACEFRISVARAKTHDHVACTLTLKNMLGCIPKGEQVWAHGAGIEPSEPLETVLKSNWLLAKNLVKIASAVKPHMGVIDGFVGMEGNGPVGGIPVSLGVAVASCDFVAADAVMATVMGFEPMEISYIYLANELGLGIGDPKSLTIIGDDPYGVRRKFRPHSNYQRTQTRWKEYAEEKKRKE
ncbi:DUF362 domain-containing protein [Candidatus Bathyarchaeota archaeon]|nr:DUF362 domain-containing protein [Candidatus Bathyarchaeota archaeon]